MNAGGGALTGNDTVSLLVTIEKPNTDTSQGAPATVTDTKTTVAGVGGLGFDATAKTWLPDAAHADYSR